MTHQKLKDDSCGQAMILWYCDLTSPLPSTLSCIFELSKLPIETILGTLDQLDALKI